jgi:pimeloyl-ACP methyl ester carboxylesterase
LRIALYVACIAVCCGDFSGRVDIGGGRKMFIECRGRGSPTVILEAGLRVRSDYWSQTQAKPPAVRVLAGIAAFTRVCVYDRPGTVIGLGIKDRSRSDPVPMPRSAMSAVADLHALVRAARLSRPFVLAGHSTGGLLVLLYAHRFPNDVAGLTLIDALTDLRSRLTPSQYATFERLNTEKPPALQSYKNYETIPFGPGFDELHRLQASHPLRPMPLVVISRGLPVALPRNGIPAGFSQALERAWRAQQNELVKIEPGAQHIIATRSDHYIMFEQPNLIARAVREVVDAVRHGATRINSR